MNHSHSHGIALIRFKDTNYKYLVIHDIIPDSRYFYSCKASGNSNEYSVKRTFFKYFNIDESFLSKVNSGWFAENEGVSAFVFDVPLDVKNEIDEYFGQGGNSNGEWIDMNGLDSLKGSWLKTQLFLFDKSKSFADPKFSNDMRANLRKLSQARERSKLVIFAGAGVSVDSGVPSWGALIDGLQSDLDKKEDDYLKLAQLYSDIRGNKEYQEKVQGALNFESTTYNPIHEKIVDLRPFHILTTNFDNHFEQINQDKGFHYSTVLQDLDLPYTTNSSLYIKMHGDLASRNIVLKKDDFDKYSEESPLIDGFIKGVFASKLVLFLGFSFNDPNLSNIWDWVGNILKKDGQKPYIIFDGIEKKERVTIEEKNLQVIDIGTRKVEKAITKYFTQVVSEKDQKILETISSSRGKKLYQFLCVLDTFDSVSDFLEGNEIENQFLKSLSRYQELRVIPSKTIEDLYPFKSKGDLSKRNILSAVLENNTLHVTNSNFYEYVKEKSENLILNFYTYREEKRSRHENDLDQIWKILFSSGVKYIAHRYNRDVDKIKLHPVNITEGIQCYCSLCLLKRFQLHLLITDLYKKSNQNICRITLEKIDNSQAYGYFMTGQVIKAFYALEELYRQASKKGKFITAFLARFNQSLMRGYVWYGNEANYQDSDLSEIIQEIDNIDIDKVLIDLPVDQQVKDALRRIKQLDIITDCSNEILITSDKVSTLYKRHIDKGTKGFYNNYGWVLSYQINMLFDNLEKNRIFFIHNDQIEYVKSKYIDSMLALYEMNNADDENYLMSKVFTRIVLKYSDSEKLISLCEEYKLSSILYDDNEVVVEELILQFKEFCNSCFQIGFNEQTIPVEIFVRHCKDSAIFSNYVSRTFNSFLILFSTTTIKKTDFSELLDLSFRFYESIKGEISQKTHTTLSYFIKKKIKYITSEEIDKSFKSLIKTRSIYYENLEDILWSIRKKKRSDLFLNLDFAELVWSIYDSRDHWKKGLVFLYIIFNEEAKLFFKQKIQSNLSNGTPEELSIALNAELWNPIDDPIIWNRYLELFEKSFNVMPDYNIEEGEVLNLESLDPWNMGVNVITLIYQYDLFLDVKIIELKEKVPSKVFQWLFDVNQFDYRFAKIDWLLLFNYEKLLIKWKKNKILIAWIEDSLEKKFNSKVSEVLFKIKS